MARRGRKPAPRGLKILAADPPAPPGFLRAEPLAEWHRLAGLFDATAADAPLLEVYCVAFGRWRTASDEVESSGPVIFSDLGGVKANPAASIAAKAEDTLVKIMAELERRATIRRSGEGPKDDLAEFLARHA